MLWCCAKAAARLVAPTHRAQAGASPAAMAPIFVGSSILRVLLVILICMIGALILHRIARSIPAIRKMTPDWQSWEQRRYFPFGLALSGIVVLYLVAAIWPQV